MPNPISMNNPTNRKAYIITGPRRRIGDHWKAPGNFERQLIRLVGPA